MGQRDFEEYLKSHKGEATATLTVDWDNRRNEWLEKLESLYGTVERYLGAYKPEVEISRRNVVLVEDYLGKYEAPSLMVNVLGQSITLEPIGTNVLGAEGRVDMTSSKGTVRLLLVDSRLIRPGVKFSTSSADEPYDENAPVELEWKIATSPPNVHYIDLRPDTFFDSLMEILNG